jgi:uroporphyrinogen decarboxylase
LKPKERVLRGINHQETDRIPIDFNGGSDEIIVKLKSYLNVSNENQLLNTLNVDIRRLSPLVYNGEQRYHMGEKADFWGVTDRALNEGDSSRHCPFAEVSSVDEVEAYKWPIPENFCDFNNISEEIEAYKDYAVHAAVWAGIFHNYIWMCGFENSLVYLHTQPQVAHAILRHITDFWIGYTKKVLEIGKGKIDIVDSFNDFGTQIDLIMSPDMLRKFIIPELKRFYKEVKEYGAKGYLHSCGSVVSIIPDLVGIGVDILDPIQVSANGMAPENLKTKFGDKITFHGAIDTQHVLPEGTIEEVRNEVNRVIGILGKGGGYILAGSQKFENDIPVENVIAMYDEAVKAKIF